MIDQLERIAANHLGAPVILQIERAAYVGIRTLL